MTAFMHEAGDTAGHRYVQFLACEHAAFGAETCPSCLRTIVYEHQLQSLSQHAWSIRKIEKTRPFTTSSELVRKAQALRKDWKLS